MLAQSPLSPLVSIQALRAVAALAIALHHGLHEADLLAKRAGGSFAWQHVFPLEAGVDLFFVISGFVMVYASRDLFGSPAAVLPFLRRRLARIVPIYWATTALFLVVSFSGLAAVNSAAPGWREIGASFAFVPFQRADGLVQPVYSLGWTLNYEMLFYALFALALPFRRGIAVPALCVVLFALAAAGRFVPADWTVAWFWTRPVVVAFALGMLIGLMALDGLRPSRAVAFVLAVAAVVLLVLGRSFPAPFDDRLIAFGLPGALLVLAALAFGELRGPVAGGMAQLGDASFALYLLHPFALRGAGLVLAKLWPSVPPLVFLALGLATACVVSLLVWRFFEKPLTRALQGPRLSS
ncbi:MAG: acyltransferase family protein [Beijerinckiaceae bacterium]